MFSSISQSTHTSDKLQYTTDRVQYSWWPMQISGDDHKGTAMICCTKCDENGEETETQLSSCTRCTISSRRVWCDLVQNRWNLWPRRTCSAWVIMGDWRAHIFAQRMEDVCGLLSIMGIITFKNNFL